MSARSIKSRQSDVSAAGKTALGRAGESAGFAGVRAALIGGLGRSLGADPHLQFSAGPDYRSPINLTLYKLDEVVSGDLDPLILPLRQEHQADLLAAMAGE